MRAGPAGKSLPSRRRRSGQSKSFVRATAEASLPTEASRR